VGCTGYSLTSAYGIVASVFNPTGAGCFAGSFNGNVKISGSLTKGGGGFLIDHPLDPMNRTLEHSFVESPDRKNIYDGIGTADSAGEVTVDLPSYFEMLNADFRYQLTPLGNAAPLFVKEELRYGRFVIGGATPGQRVCWLVTGIRRDAWALANPMTVEAAKPQDERGLFLYPEAFGQPREKSVDLMRHPHIQRMATPPPAPNAEQK
jgi:hypothetical protein